MQKNVLAESQEHNDLVVEDFHDVYLNLTMKTGFLLKWLSQDCPEAKFILKVASTLFLHIWPPIMLKNIVSHIHTCINIISIRWTTMYLSTLNKSGKRWNPLICTPPR